MTFFCSNLFWCVCFLPLGGWSCKCDGCYCRQVQRKVIWDWSTLYWPGKVTELTSRSLYRKPVDCLPCEEDYPSGNLNFIECSKHGLTFCLLEQVTVDMVKTHHLKLNDPAISVRNLVHSWVLAALDFEWIKRVRNTSTVFKRRFALASSIVIYWKCPFSISSFALQYLGVQCWVLC